MSQKNKKKPTLGLTDIAGIGDKTAKKMIACGIMTVEELATLRPEKLSNTIECTLKKAKDFVNLAVEIVRGRAIEIYTAKEIFKIRSERVKMISTGSTNLDKILGGGIQTDAITGVAGELSVGKSQIAFQAEVNCILDLGRHAAHIETEPQTFNSKRIIEISKGRATFSEIAEMLHVVPHTSVTNPYQQFNAYQEIDKLIENGTDIGLLVIDSFTAKFRPFFTGREMLPDRGAELSRHIGFLETMASKHNMAIFMTCQVMGVPDSGAQLGIIKKYGGRKEIWGGDYFKHSITYWLYLQEIKKDHYKATLFDAPDMPRAEAEYIITSRGIRDVV